MKPEKQPRPVWSALDRDGCKNVEGKVLLIKDGLTVANLRFNQNATIDKHSASFDIDVICVSGSGFTLIGNKEFTISAGETMRWPKNIEHCLWTKDSTMETIMIERTSY